jgi:hypothetical protein
MENTRLPQQIVGLIIIFVMSACGPDSGAAGGQAKMPDESQMQSGDLLYRFGNGLYSAYFRSVSQTDQRFSHVGIVVRTSVNGPVQVVHAEADDVTGQGGVRMDLLSNFLMEAGDWAVYRLHSEQVVRSAIAERALDYQRRAVPFDLAFDVADTTAFYCTELVQHCVNAALGRPLIQPHTQVDGKPVVAVDDTYLNDEMVPVPF